jgi:hypothetical protein
MGVLLWALWAGLSGAVAGEPAPVLRVDDRVEVAVERGEDWAVVPAGAAGAVLIGAAERGRQWTLRGLSTDLQPTWTVTHTSDDRLRLEGWHAEGGKVHVLLHGGSSPRFTVLEVGVADGTLEVHSYESPARRVAFVDELTVADGTAWVLASRTLGGWEGRNGSLFAIPDGGAPRVVPVAEAFDAKRVWIERLSTDPRSGRVELAGLTVKRRRNTLLLAGLDDGRVVDPLQMSAPRGADWNPLDAQRVRVDGRALVVGTWADGEKGFFAQGFFVAPVEGGAVGPAVRTSFTELQHFFDHLPPRREARLEAKAARAKAAGEDLDVSQNLFVHDLYAQDGQLVLVGEAWTPVYRTETTTTTSTTNGVTTTTTTTRRIWVGNLFTHAVLIGLSPEGKPLWDQSVQIGDVIDRQMRPHVRAHIEGDRVTVLHHNGGKVTRRVFVGGAPVAEAERAVIETPEGDRVKRGYESQAELWYDDQFLLWGVQRVVGEDGKQTVFGVSKIGPEVAAGPPAGG